MKDALKSPFFWGFTLLMLLALSVIVYYAPVERTMGLVQKVFYFHVASAWVGLVAHTVVFAASILYLWKRSGGSDRLARASAEIGTVFISCTLLTGPLWAYPIWNTWWTWDPRLTTTLVLWFMCGLHCPPRRGCKRSQEAPGGCVRHYLFYQCAAGLLLHPLVALHPSRGDLQRGHRPHPQDAGGYVCERGSLFCFILLSSAAAHEVAGAAGEGAAPQGAAFSLGF